MSSNQAVTATFNLTSGTGIGVNGLNVTYIGASISCTNSGGFFDNCSGSVSLNVGVAIENGVVAVAMDQLNYGGGSNPYAAGTVPGLITVSIAGGDMPQGTCSAGTINTDIEVIDGYGDGTNVTIGYSASVPLTISCGAGA
jgi:hypothetical protein